LIDIRYAKGAALRPELYSRWNSFSRIGVSPARGPGEFDIVIDADASTSIATWDLNHLTPSQKSNLLVPGPGFAYAMRPAAKTLIIGPGGGWDIARAIASGSRDITAVEINPIIATNVMRSRFADE